MKPNSVYHESAVNFLFIFIVFLALVLPWFSPLYLYYLYLWGVRRRHIKKWSLNAENLPPLPPPPQPPPPPPRPLLPPNWVARFQPTIILCTWLKGRFGGLFSCFITVYRTAKHVSLCNDCCKTGCLSAPLSSRFHEHYKISVLNISTFMNSTKLMY